jgi:hypothetical protein
VHHPPKTYPDLVNVPKFVASVNDTPCVLVWLDGAEPDVAEFASYDTEYVVGGGTVVVVVVVVVVV